MNVWKKVRKKTGGFRCLFSKLASCLLIIIVETTGNFLIFNNSFIVEVVAEVVVEVEVLQIVIEVIAIMIMIDIHHRIKIIVKKERIIECR